MFDLHAHVAKQWRKLGVELKPEDVRVIDYHPGDWRYMVQVQMTPAQNGTMGTNDKSWYPDGFCTEMPT